MKRSIAVLCLILMVGACLAATASAAAMNLMTGREKGTYYQFGLNLQQLVKSRGIELGVQPSTGSIENLYAVYQRPNTQVGIVQSDVLAFVSRVQTNPILSQDRAEDRDGLPALQRGDPRARAKGIADFDGLQGKRVAVGRGRERHLPDRPPAVGSVRGEALRNGPDRHGRGARPS